MSRLAQSGASTRKS